MGFKAGLGRFKEYKWLLSRGVGTPLLGLVSLGTVSYTHLTLPTKA